MSPFALLLLLVPPASPMQVPPCIQSNLSVTFDNVNGRFDGKTESGGLLVIRNFGDQPCTVLPRPTFRFEDQAGKPLSFTWAAPRYMHPGPVMIPVIIAPGAEVTGRMQWISNPADHTLACARTAIMQVNVQGADGPRIPFAHDVCGPTFTLEPLHPDPIPKP